MYNFLKGRKTYVVAALMIVYAAIGMVLGQIDQDSAVRLILEALGLSALRAGISNS